MKLRTFVAIEIETDIRRALAEFQDRLRPYARGVKWVKPSNIHLTLKFLGDVEEPRMGDVVRVVETCGADSTPFTLVVRGGEAFPHLRAPRVIVVRAYEPTGALAHLYAALEKGFAALGFKRERRSFKPHLTLGRVRRGVPGEAFSEQMRMLSDADGGQQQVRAVAVMTSDLTPSGPVYTRVGEASLGRAGGP